MTTEVVETKQKKPKLAVGKYAFLNFTGNVGKTTVAKHVFMPRLQDPEYFAVESINADEGEGEVVRGKQWGLLQEELMVLDSAIVDVGASNVEDFIKLVKQYHGSHEEFDMFVIPTVAESKQLRDTIATVDALAAIGVPPEKIRVVFNRLEADQSVEDDFYPLIAYYEETKRFNLRMDAAIHFNELYHKMRSYDVTIESLLADKTDWRAEMRKTSDPAERRKAQSMVSMSRLAYSAKENLDAVFTALMRK